MFKHLPPVLTPVLTPALPPIPTTPAPKKQWFFIELMNSKNFPQCFNTFCITITVILVILVLVFTNKVTPDITQFVISILKFIK